MGEPKQSHSSGAHTASQVRPSGSVAPDGPADGAALSRTLLDRLRGHFRAPGRPRVWFELVLIGVSYWVYSLIRNAVPTHEAAAEQNAHSVWSLEQHLGIDAERAVNHWFNSVGWLITGMNYYYATLHFIMTIGVLVWLFRSHPGRYHAARLALMVTTCLALLGYYFCPLAPPRLLAGGHFIDTVAVHHTWGSMASGDMASVSNQYAAMPSMHIGWSLFCGITIATLARRRWVKVLGALYPLATLVVIVGTANHYFLDALAGATCTFLGFLASRLVYGRWAYAFPRRAASAQARAAEPASDDAPAAEPVEPAEPAAAIPADPREPAPAETAPAAEAAGAPGRPEAEADAPRGNPLDGTPEHPTELAGPVR